MGSGLALGTLPGPKPIWQTKAFVDFQNDVKARDIDLAVREGMRSIEHIKRYTTNGMATDQGKTSNLNGLQIASGSLAKPVTDIGLTTFRPPYTPQTFGALMGHHKDALFQPIRKTVIDGWAADHGAVFENVAQWRRARYFRKGAKTCTPPWRGNAWPCASGWGCSTLPPSARSKWSAPMPPNSSTACTPTRGKPCSRAAAAMACCCARMGSSPMMAFLRAWRPIAFT
jgi:hypothetical protein